MTSHFRNYNTHKSRMEFIQSTKKNLKIFEALPIVSPKLQTMGSWSKREKAWGTGTGTLPYRNVIEM